jgi:hypothetical protein
MLASHYINSTQADQPPHKFNTSWSALHSICTDSTQAGWLALHSICTDSTQAGWPAAQARQLCRCCADAVQAPACVNVSLSPVVNNSSKNDNNDNDDQATTTKATATRMSTQGTTSVILKADSRF